MRRILRYCPPILLLSLLVACSSSAIKKPDQAGADSHTQSQNEKISDLLKMAQKSPPEQANRYLLEAAQGLLLSKQAREADKVLRQINYVTLPPDLKQRFLLAYGRAQLLLDKPDLTVRALSGDQFNLNLLPADLTPEDRIAIDRLRAKAEEASGNYLAAAKERILFNALLTAEEQKNNNERIWTDLQQTAQHELEILAYQQDNTDLRGWAQLALIPLSFEHDLDAQLSALRQWQKQWPQHAAAQQLPRELGVLGQSQSTRPKHIALLLPLSGPLASAGIAIRDGFLSSFYLSYSGKHAPPQLSIIDSEASGKSFIQRYQDISASGVDLIIGPLKKEQVSALQKLDSLTVPTLALNYGAVTEKNPANLFQFGLSPEDDSKQIALKAVDQSYQKAVLLSADNDWGHRMSTAFIENWQQMGGVLLAKETFSVKDDYAYRLKSLLNIPESEKRGQRIKQVLNENIVFRPYRRHDIDFLVLFAQNTQAKQIVPTLAYVDALNIPIYSSADIYDFTQNNANYFQDLNGVQFCDIPWILKSKTRARQLLHSAWPDQNGPYERLHALGADAFYLSARLTALQTMPDSIVSGHTGSLRLLSNRRLERFPSWAKFKDGAPVLIGDPILTEIQK